MSENPNRAKRITDIRMKGLMGNQGRSKRFLDERQPAEKSL